MDFTPDLLDSDSASMDFTNLADSPDGSDELLCRCDLFVAWPEFPHL